MKPQYTIEVYPLGWILSGNQGIPINALNDSLALFPPDAIMHTGILHHLRFENRRACMCITTPEKAKIWEKEINSTLETLEPEQKWWHGLNVGTSSTSIFSTFCQPSLQRETKEYSKGSTPQDSSDLQRCFDLLKIFPAWRENLVEVSKKYPKTKWKEIVANWEILEKSNREEQTLLLQQIQKK